MLDTKRVRFIINPISGGKSKTEIPALVQQYLSDSFFKIDFAFTESAAHTSFLAQECVQLNYDWAIAVGGDGTVNQVAAQLINSEVALGIIPFGSGNGLARALNISMQSKKAIIGLNQTKVKRIDTGTANNIPFVNVCGFGFDAHVSAAFANMGARGFKTYAKASLQAIQKYQPEVYEITINEQKEEISAFVLAVCNGPQYGNNAYIAPQADLADGQFDITQIEHVNWSNIIGLGSNLFLKKLSQSPYVKTLKTNKLQVNRVKENYVNIDGEAIWFEKNVQIKLLPLSLNVLIPT
jgi:YegS/Rv2252/BmrU family lipid kinase